MTCVEATSEYRFLSVFALSSSTVRKYVTADWGTITDNEKTQSTIQPFVNVTCDHSSTALDIPVRLVTGKPWFWRFLIAVLSSSFRVGRNCFCNPSSIGQLPKWDRLFDIFVSHFGCARFGGCDAVLEIVSDVSRQVVHP